MSPGPDEPVAIAIPPDLVPQVWPHASGMIRRASERGRLSRFDVIEKQIERGDAVLWVVWDGNTLLGAAAHSIEVTDHDKVFVVLACGGDGFSRWGHLISKMEDYAKSISCTRMRMFGRNGWKRVLRDWTQTGVVLDRVI